MRYLLLRLEVTGKLPVWSVEIFPVTSMDFKSAIFVQTQGTLSHTYSKYGSHSHSWNDEYHAFGYQLDQWGVENLFQNSDEAITREFKFYIETWEK